MNIPKSLLKLAEKFPVPLYVVGGAVRDFLLGYPQEDFDIASSLSPAEVIDFVSRLLPEYKIDPTSKKLGTLKIEFEGDSFEYTCFRKDSYGSDGRHLPSEVEFVDSVELDSFRRDFTVNAIYYDIKEEEFIDYTGGVEDLKNKTLRAVREPDLVLNEDALRILRMVRLAAAFDFKIEKNTLDSAKKNVDNLKNIAPERIRDEFDKIILADTIVGISQAHVKGVRMLTEIGAMKYIIPELLLGIGMAQRPDFHKYDVYNHILAVFEASPPEIRLAALLHDIAKPIQMQKNGNMYEHDKVGGEIAVKVMSTLKYSTKEISFVKKLVQNHMYDLNLVAKDSTIKKFIRKNEDIIPSLIELKKADRKGGGILQTESESAKRLKTTYEEMKKSGVPFNTKDLKVNGEDLIKLGIPPQHRSKALEALLDRGSYDYSVHSRDEALNFLKTFRDNL